VASAGAYTKGATDNLDAQVNGDPTDSAGAAYVPAALVLYRALSGDRNLDRKVDNTGTTDTGINLAGTTLTPALPPPLTVYYPFPSNMLLPAGGTGKVTNLIDPFGYSYGYSTAYQGDIATGVTPPYTWL